MPNKIRVKNTLVELDGDEMTRVMWRWVKDRLLTPYLDMNIEYYDLGLEYRDQTADKVTADAAEAIRRHRVGVKCATITPNKERIAEYKLHKEWSSPNATLRAALDGTVFRAPIFVRNVKPSVRSWKKPIHIGRHAYGDVYKNMEIRVPGAGRGELVFTPDDGGAPVRQTIHQFRGPGVLQGIHNTDASITSFAKACFNYGLDQKIDVWFASKDTISKTYDGRFKEIFQQEYDTNWKARFGEAGIEYFYTLIDDAVARIMKSAGGVLWACKNYDGDVMSDMLGSAYGSLAMMTSVLVSPDGCFEYEAAHGTVQRHYYKHLKGEKTSTNPMALIFAWTGGLRKRGEMDGTKDVVRFAGLLEKAARKTVENGVMTGDLLAVARKSAANRAVHSEEFIQEIGKTLDGMLHPR
jgi:isocitrate dehydrogenase